MGKVIEVIRADDFSLVSYRLPEWVAKSNLYEVLKLGVHVTSDGFRELAFHSQHKQLQTFNHGDHFRNAKLLLARVVVAR